MYVMGVVEYAEYVDDSLIYNDKAERLQCDEASCEGESSGGMCKSDGTGECR